MKEVNLLKSLPVSKRNVSARLIAKTDDHIKVSREYGRLYFDGPREYGYGGYKYDGRWKPVAQDILEFFSLRPGDRFLDVGCAKGFLVKDLLSLGIDAYGIDVSDYAIQNCEPEVVGRLHLGTAEKLPFPSNSFQAVVSVNTVHNLARPECIRALQEIERLAPGRGFVQVDSYLTPEQKKIFENWVLTAKFYGYPKDWIQVFYEAGYTGHYYWTIINDK
jgi:ubiquinone/menaquinone biosynthesis C-methylase UbiE